MDIAAIIFLSAFAVIGVILLFEKLLYGDLYPYEVIISSDTNENDIEQLIRSLRHHFPRAIITAQADGEAAEIAKRLSAGISPQKSPSV